jgi:hypothetical protein
MSPHTDRFMPFQNTEPSEEVAKEEYLEQYHPIHPYYSYINPPTRPSTIIHPQGQRLRPTPHGPTPKFIAAEFSLSANHLQNCSNLALRRSSIYSNQCEVPLCLGC